MISPQSRSLNRARCGYSSSSGVCPSSPGSRGRAPLSPVGEHLVGGHRHRAHLLAVARVLADHRRVDLRLVDELGDPLPDRGDAGGEDERGRLQEVHAEHPDDGLARAAGQDDHAGASALGPAGVERLGRLALVGPRNKGPLPGQRGLAKGHGESFPGGIPGAIVDRVPDADHGELQLAAGGRGNRPAGVGEALAEEQRRLLVRGHEIRKALVPAPECQPAAAAFQDHAAEPPGVLDDLDGNVLGHRVAGERAQGLHDLHRVLACGARIPDGKRRETVGVDVLG